MDTIPASKADRFKRDLAHEIKLRQRAETLLKIAKAMRSGFDLPTVLQEALDVTWQFLRPAFAGIFLIDDSEHFYLAASTDLENERKKVRWAANDGLLSRILISSSPTHLPQLHLERMLQAERDFFKPQSSSCMSIIPMRHHETPNGMLVLQWDQPELSYSEDDHELLSGIAELAALAIENQRLIQQEALNHSGKMLADILSKERHALIRQIVHDLRNSAQTLSLINEEIELHAHGNPNLLFATSAIDRQISFLSNFLKEKLERSPHDPKGSVPSTKVCQVVKQSADRNRDRFLNRGQSLESTPLCEEMELAIPQEDLEIALEILLENARLYCPSGAHIKLWCSYSDGWTTLYVADDGPGIPLDQQPHLGESGFRGRLDVPGKGQGLSTLKRIVTENGGLFGFTSRPGSGATFFFMLPTTRWGMA